MHADEVAVAVSAEDDVANGLSHASCGLIRAVPASECTGAVCSGIRHAHLLSDHGHRGEAAGKDQQNGRHEGGEFGGHAPPFTAIPTVHGAPDP